MVDTEPCELPKWNDATPFADGLAWAAQRRLIIRSAPTVLAVVARSASDGLRFGGRDRKVSMPIAVIRPSSRLARSHRMSASLIGPAPALDDQAMIGAASARVDDDALAGQPGTRPSDQFLLADGLGGAAGDPGAQKVQRPQCLRSADAVGRHAVLPLIRHQRVVGEQPEVAVYQAGVEAEVLEPGLQGGDVVAVHRRAELVTEDAGAEAIGRLFECAIGRLTDDAVDEQAAMLLEGADRLVEFESK